MRIYKLITLLFFFVGARQVFAQASVDNINLVKVDTSLYHSNSINTNASTAKQKLVLKDLLAKNKFINLKSNPVYFISKKKQVVQKEYLFYLLCIVILVFCFFKIVYEKYFNNIFRVFFNTSLRQNQLTDLLLQARLPSLIFNIFFSISAGLYMWLLISHYSILYRNNNVKILIICIASISIIYLVKFCVLKVIGWITDMSNVINTYIFIIFLINKIIGILLLPFLIFIAFASAELIDAAVILSLIVITVFFIMRFFRSYNLLQQQLNLNKMHFLVYMISLEILPLFIIYKLAFKIL